MGIKIHGSPFSGPTLRAVAAAHEKELDFEFVLVDMRSGAHKQEAHLSLNPFGQVPAFEDGDVKVFESRAITKYIAYNYKSQGTPLLCEDKSEMVTQVVWTEVEAHQFDPVANKLIWELIVKGFFGMQTDDTVVEENEAKLAKVLDVYESHLANSKYLAGGSFSLVDLHHLPTLHNLNNTKVKHLIDERPHVSAWCKDILARPSWEKTIALQKH